MIGWHVSALNIILSETEFYKLSKNKLLFWENGIWSGRTYLSIWFAVNLFNQNSNWKFGVHTSYPYVKDIDKLVDIKSSEVQEGVEDIQGMGDYIFKKFHSNFDFVTYQQRIKDLKEKYKFKEEHNDIITNYFALIKKVKKGLILENVSLSNLPFSVLIRIFLREKDRYHPNNDALIFKHFLHLLYFNSSSEKQSYRSIYFDFQSVLLKIELLSETKEFSETFQKMKEYDLIVRPFEELVLLATWLNLRPYYLSKLECGIKAIKTNLDDIKLYMSNKLLFKDLLRYLTPKVGIIDIDMIKLRKNQIDIIEESDIFTKELKIILNEK